MYVSDIFVNFMNYLMLLFCFILKNVWKTITTMDHNKQIYEIFARSVWKVHSFPHLIESILFFSVGTDQNCYTIFHLAN